jgi:hypothetical protein
MASGAKKKTTMAKMNRERNLRERRFEKQAKKDARKRAAAAGEPAPGTVPDETPVAEEALPSGEPVS